MTKEKKFYVEKRYANEWSLPHTLTYNKIFKLAWMEDLENPEWVKRYRRRIKWLKSNNY